MDEHYPIETLTFAGYATPELALETYAWAFFRNNRAAMMQTVAPEWRKHLDSVTDNQINAAVESAVKHSGYAIIKKVSLSKDKVELHTSFTDDGGIIKWKLEKYEDGWRVAGVMDH